MSKVLMHLVSCSLGIIRRFMTIAPYSTVFAYMLRLSLLFQCALFAVLRVFFLRLLGHDVFEL